MVIRNTGFQFASVQSLGDQCVFVCFLAVPEIQKLKTERGWKFHENLFHDGY
jgi:hypothetical protein